MSAGPALLAREKVDRYRPFGAFGKPVYQSHVQLHAMLRAKRGVRFADYFAKPTYDPDTGELRWMAHGPGVARGWHHMPPEEQARHAQDLEAIRAGLASFVLELRAQGGAEPGGAAAFASLLEQAMQVPAQGDFLYVVGDQPVIAFWGFENQAGASVDPARAVPQAPPPLPAELVASLAPPPTAAPVPAPPARGRPWWLWLLLALLVLLLLAALFFGLRACDTAPVVPVAPLPAPVASQPEPPASVPAPVASVPALPAPVAPEPVPGASEPELPASVPAPVALAPEPAASTPPLIEIPDGALERKDLSFLEGTWTYGTLHTYGKDPKKPTGRVRMLLQFDGQGGGSLRGTDRMANGRPAPDCRGGLRTRTDGRKLYITEEDCRVSGQQGVGASRMECERNADGKTLCWGVNHDGVRWSTELRKIQ